MGGILRVLMVEDSEDDAQLILRTLSMGGFDPRPLRVETADAMNRALEDGTWDVVLSDYKLPRFSAPEALKTLKRKGPDIPFLIVSGTIGEETAVDAMKAGAHDFFVKGKLARLCAAIEREMRESAIREENRKADEILRESEEKYRTLVENIPEIVWRMTEARKMIFVSGNALRVSGYSPQEFYAMEPDFLLSRVDPDQVDSVGAAFAGLFENKDVHMDIEYRFQRKDGRWVWLWSRAVRRFLRAGTLYVDGLTSDITRLKTAEQKARGTPS